MYIYIYIYTLYSDIPWPFHTHAARYSIEPFLHQARRVLRGSGVLIFSTEAASEAEAEAHGGTVERASERFAHGRTMGVWHEDLNWYNQ